MDLKNRIAAVQKKKLKNHVVASLMKFAIARKKNLVGAQKAIAPVNKKFNLLQSLYSLISFDRLRMSALVVSLSNHTSVIPRSLLRGF
ncbi:MAG: hypothetical protein US03_C0010G0017 [candidate division TM6 bacterium GW2011_GWF2_36_131]|nr:MAG: hypothetical protein US03_C0010G0017 [candidate division TM6 bacterium GW2011_GWF2_36_131]